jgi:hypothetical protein
MSDSGEDGDNKVSELRFSRRTVIAAIEVLESQFHTHDSLERYLLKLNRDLAARCASGYLSAKFTALVKAFDDEPDMRLEDGESLWDKLVEQASSSLPSNEPSYPEEEPPYLRPEAAELVHTLELDGFTVSEGALRRALPVDIGLPTVQSELDRLLEKHGLTIPKGHLTQALDGHGRGNWAAANSQIRTFMEALFDEIAVRIDPAAAGLASGQPRRTRLASHGFLSRDLNEWDDKGLGFINGLVKRLHPQGSHPGLSDDDDSTFRLHVVLLSARLLLARFDGWGSK